MDINDKRFQEWLLSQDIGYLSILYDAYEHQLEYGAPASITLSLNYPAITDDDINRLRAHLDRHGLTRLKRNNG